MSHKKKFILQINPHQAIILGGSLGLIMALGMGTWLSLGWMRELNNHKDLASRSTVDTLPSSPTTPTTTSTSLITVLVPRFHLPAELLIEREDWFEEQTVGSATVANDVVTSYKQIKARRITKPLIAGQPFRLQDTEPATAIPKLSAGDVQLRLPFEKPDTTVQWQVGQRVDLIYQWQNNPATPPVQGRIPKLAIMAIETDSSPTITLRIRHRDAESFQMVRQKPGFRFTLSLSPPEAVGP